MLVSTGTDEAIQNLDYFQEANYADIMWIQSFSHCLQGLQIILNWEQFEWTARHN